MPGSASSDRNIYGRPRGGAWRCVRLSFNQDPPMQTMTNYPPLTSWVPGPRCGWLLLKALAGASVVVGLLAALADAAVAAPATSVTITERTAAAAAQTAKAPKVMGDVKP